MSVQDMMLFLGIFINIISVVLVNFVAPRVGAGVALSKSAKERRQLRREAMYNTAISVTMRMLSSKKLHIAGQTPSNLEPPTDVEVSEAYAGLLASCSDQSVPTKFIAIFKEKEGNAKLELAKDLINKIRVDLGYQVFDFVKSPILFRWDNPSP